MNKKTPVWQIVLLIVLLGVMAFGMYRAFSGAMAPARRPASQPSETAAVSATDMPDVVPGSAGQRQSGELGLDATSRASQINPNLFKVYQVEPPKNPFVQDTEWYADKLANVPGYPELTESDYFESMDPYLPDIPFIYDDPASWQSVSINKSQDNSFTLSGISEDGRVQTSVSLTKDVPTAEGFSWDKSSAFPLAALKDPEWVKAQMRKAAEQTESGAPLPDESLFDEQGLPIPGMDTVSGTGDTFSCHGVSIKGDKSSALILYNGSPRIVTEGMALPTHYEVLEINQDGVVLVDVRSGFSIHVPLGGEPAPNV